MFVQIIQGTCHDPSSARQSMDDWIADLAPSARGWLGTTAGVTADGRLFAAARFASEDEARANSDRPEQGAWWAQFVKSFDGEPTVHDCRTADLWLGGGSDDAGFVQVMQFDIRNRDAAQALMAQMQQMSADDLGRSDVIGGTIAWHADDEGATQVVYFTSEEEARRGEAQQPPAEAEEQFAQMAEAFGEPRYLDLTEPWLYSPR